jgi:aminoglycoside/choline kinase family phosphotransferase
MASPQNTPSDPRLQQLNAWLQSIATEHGLNTESLAPASSDASFRRYFRLQGRNGTVVVMDAPPDREDCAPFIHVTGLLQQAGVHVPAILASNPHEGFLLLTDLGRHTYYQVLQTSITDAQLQSIYRDALNALVTLQHAPVTGLPVYNAQRLLDELAVFPEWYVQKHCNTELTPAEQEMLSGIFGMLVADAAAQPQVLVHRDFHSPNLMLTAPETNPGVIDYQDALAGPISYDIASLVTDARTTWEEPQQLDWAIRYWEKARTAQLPVADDFAEFHRQYEWISLQRNLRIMGVFARLSLRDGKHHYLDHLPRVSGYVRQVASRYNAFRPLVRLLDRLQNIKVTQGYTF